MYFTQKHHLNQVHQIFFECGVHPTDLDIALPSTIAFLEWIVTTKSRVITRRMRLDASMALSIALTSPIAPVDPGFCSYRSALLRLILSRHSAKIAKLESFSAEDFPDVSGVYTPAAHARGFPGSS